MAAIKSDSLNAIRFQKLLMIITGMWPRKNATIIYHIRNILAWLFVCVTILALFIELYISANDYNKFSDLLSLQISLSIYMVKRILFARKRYGFLVIVQKLRVPILQDYPIQLDGHMASAIKISQKISIGYQLCCAIVIFLYSCKPFVSATYELPFSVSFVGDVGNLKYLVHFWQSTGMFLAAWNNSCLDSIAAGLMAVGAAHFEILADKLSGVRHWAGLNEEEINAGKVLEETHLTEETDTKVEEEIGKCVVHHMAILEFLMTVEEVFSFGFLAQFVNSVVVICNTGFQMVHSEPISLQFAIMAMYFTSMMTQLALYCWFGNELMVKSLKIKDACYMSNWTSCGPKVRKSLCIIMERSKRPFYLTAGKFAYLSLESYTSVIHSAYSYFALMQRLYSTQE